MTDKQAKNLETLLKALPKTQEFSYRKTALFEKALAVNDQERSDVSWISTETPDRYDHVVYAKGMNDSQYALNPIVTLNHDYHSPPIGRSLWRKYDKFDTTKGIKAKTVYPRQPEGWNTAEVWQPDQVWAQIKAGLLNAKSIGWLPTKAHFAEPKEVMKNDWKAGTLVVEEWLLVEYAVGVIPVNPETVVEKVSEKALKSDVSTADKRANAKYSLKDKDGAIKYPINDCDDVKDAWNLRGSSTIPQAKVERYVRRVAKALGCDGPWNDGGKAMDDHEYETGVPIIEFTTLAEIQRVIHERLAKTDISHLVHEALERKKGRV